MRAAARTRWIIAAALTAAAFAWAGAAPADDPEVPERYISVDEAHKLLGPAKRAVFIDVRIAEQFRDLHIRGARNVPLAQLPKRLAEIPREQFLVLY